MLDGTNRWRGHPAKQCRMDIAPYLQILYEFFIKIGDLKRPEAEGQSTALNRH